MIGFDSLDVWRGTWFTFGPQNRLNFFLRFKKPKPLSSRSKVKADSVPEGTLTQAELVRRANEIFETQAIEESQRVSKFGKIKPIITAENWGKRLVAVGGVLYSGNWKYFADFLDAFLQARFGGDWTEAQTKLDPIEKHPLTLWRTRALIYAKKALMGAPQDKGVLPNGSMAAYFGFAYDLYVVDHNNNLDDRLLQRLKNREQFQGARHELFAEATCLRAGFTVAHEDATDPSRRHVEFIATDPQSGIRLAVEAKSRHRPGVIAQFGAPEAEDQADFKFSRLVNDAIAKQSTLPLAIFVATNLPPRRARNFFGEPASKPVATRYLKAIIEGFRKRNGGHDPYNLLVFTNFPHHYGRDDERDPRRDWIAHIAQAPVLTVPNPDVLLRLATAAELYGVVPNTFPIPNAVT